MTCVIVIFSFNVYIKDNKLEVFPVKEKVFQFLKNVKLPVKTGDIVKQFNIDRNEAQKIINELVLEGKIETDRCFNKVINVGKGGRNDR